MLVLLLLLSLGIRGNLANQVDKIELNHYYDAEARLCYDQIIIQKWSPDYGRFDTQDWWLVEDLEDYPNRDSRGWFVFNKELKQPIVRTKIYVETWTFDFDPERWSKKLFDEKYRVPLQRK